MTPENWIDAGSSVLGIASNVFGTLMGAKSQKDANQEQMRRWYEQQEYNSPVNQAKRLREAGINPAFAMQQGMMDSGNASSPADSPTAPQYDFSPSGSMLMQGISNNIARRKADAEIRNLEANSEHQEIANKYANMKNLLELFKIRSDMQKTGKDTKLIDQQIEYQQKFNAAFDERNEVEVQRIRAEAAKFEKESQLLELQQEYQRIVNHYAPGHQEALIRQLDAHSEEMLAAAYAHNTQALYNLAEKALSEAQKEGVVLDNKQKDSVLSFVVDSYESKADEAYWNAQYSARRARNGKIGDYIPDLPSVFTGTGYHTNYKRRSQRLESKDVGSGGVR